MSAFLASFAVSSGTSGTATLSIVRGIFPVRISQILVSGQAINGAGSATAQLSYTASMYPSSTPSGGSAVTPLAARSGGAPTATVKSGSTISGSSLILKQANQETSGSFLVQVLNDNYSPPFDFFINAGAALFITGTFSSNFSGNMTVEVYYDEEHLARST